VRGEVLVVEDNAVNRILLNETLTMMGLTISVAENGAEAVALLEHRSFDVVLMDWHMPQMDGLEATRRIRARESTLRSAQQRVCIVGLSASVMDNDRGMCLRVGMDDFLCKPFIFDELIAILERWLPQPESQVA
jgi:CheY-like chemotaxis protein